MSTEARAVHFPAEDWGGGVHPYRVGHRKLGMRLFIVSDSLTFSALLIGYSYLRASNVWPTPFPFYPSIVFSSIMTFCLLSSSLTMVFGVSASRRGDKARARKWILDVFFRGCLYRSALDRMDPLIAEVCSISLRPIGGDIQGPNGQCFPLFGAPFTITVFTCSTLPPARFIVVVAARVIN